MAERQFIPILGVDQRPLAREAPAGLCKHITGLRPSGPKKRPHWKPAGIPTELENASGQPLDHPKKGQIVDSFFKLGHQTAGGGQTKRLVLVFSDGTLDVLNPDGAQGWDVVTSYSFGGAEGSWSADFAPVSETLAIAIARDGQPHRLLYLYNDQIVPYGFPFLPTLAMKQQNDIQYTTQQIEAGTNEGLAAGYYGYRYGFRLSDGHNVGVCPPIPFQVETTGDDYFRRLVFTLTGYNIGYQPESYDFWKDYFVGIDLFLSEKHDSKKDVLMNGIFYKAVSFDAITAADTTQNPRVFGGTYDDIPKNRVLDVGTEDVHTLAAGVIHSYNARLLLGDVAVDFAPPPTSIYGFLGSQHRITMSPGEYITDQYPVRGSYYETYSVTHVVYTLTARDAVLPAGAVTVSNLANGIGAGYDGQGKTQIDDQTVSLRYLINSGDPDRYYHPDGPLTFDVAAQAYETAAMSTQVGDAFTAHIGGS